MPRALVITESIQEILSLDQIVDQEFLAEILEVFDSSCDEDFDDGVKSVLRQFTKSALVGSGATAKMGSPDRIIKYIEGLQGKNPTGAAGALSLYRRTAARSDVHQSMKAFATKIVSYFEKKSANAAVSRAAGKEKAASATHGAYLGYQDRKQPGLARVHYA